MGGNYDASAELLWSIIRDSPYYAKAVLPPGYNRDDWVYKIEDHGLGRFRYERSDGVSVGPVRIGPMKGEAKSWEDARAVVDQDWEQLQRLGSWVSYMLSNNPPTR